jgi:ADP-ribose pyrophosphatase YjhB (NUDIX family)
MQEPSVHRYDAAGGVVTDATGERVLLLGRPDLPGPAGGPEVRLPKGHVESGESLEQAACREVGEESGLWDVEIVADLGSQIVGFDFGTRHTIRTEYYFLMISRNSTAPLSPEPQFVPLWLPWEKALERLTYEAEREWLRRARLRLASLPPDRT